METLGTDKKISIVVVNWNGKRFLKDCLGSLLAQTYANHEIILVDNGSGDDSVRYVREHFPAVAVVALAGNAGFTGGNAAGFRVARGEFICLVNNDTRVHERWLENLVQPMLTDGSVGICASKILFETNGTLNSAGDGITTAAVGFNFGLNQEEAAQFNTPNRVFGACGAAVLYRRRMLEEIGFLDEDFFLYDEDTDLSFRAQLAGWKCAFVPTALVHHRSNATSVRLSDTHVYYHARNLEFVWIKNMPAGLMLRFAPQKLIQEIGSFCYLCLRHGKWNAYFRAKRDALRMLPLMKEKRKNIQLRRRVSNFYLRSMMTPLLSMALIRQKIRQFIYG
jgi:GT2 family glycosyltransferase